MDFPSQGNFLQSPFEMGSFLLGLARRDPQLLAMAEASGITPDSLNWNMSPSSDVLGSLLGSPGMPGGEGGAMTGALGSLASGSGDQGPPMVSPEGAPQPPQSPMFNATVRPTPQQRFPQVRMPEQTRPQFSGGVAGAQKAPDFGVKAGVSPAQALLQAILGRGAMASAGGGGGQRQQQSLGDILGG